MPSRLLREGILDSEAVCSLTFPAEVFYRRLMSVVDDFGRFDGRSTVLRSRLYPLQIEKVREADIPRWIAECEKAGLIALYSVSGKPYVLFRKLGSPRANSSKYPDPPKGCDNQCEPDYIRKHPLTDENGCEQMKSSVPRSGSGSNAGSGSGSNADSSAASAAKPLPDKPPDAILEFPTVGRGPTSWALTQRQIDEWAKLYPSIDVFAECRKALAWINANTKKTAGGMPKFLVSWLNRSTDTRSQSTPKPVFRNKAEVAADHLQRSLEDVYTPDPEMP